ncbi:MAG: hypothetical protein ACYS29_06820, partial [Planctomycetota bacterium]
MEIDEVPIGPQKKLSKKASVKVREYAKKYLAQIGIKMDQLNSEQERFVLKYAAHKIGLRYSVVILLVTAVAVGIFAVYFYWRITEKMDPMFIPESQIVVTDVDGTESVREVPPEVIEYVTDYGRVCSLLAAVTTGAA